jgi:hypothetical protein
MMSHTYIRYNITYDKCIYLWVLPSKSMLREVKGVAARLWSAIVEFTLPLNGSKGAKMTLCARNQVVLKDGIELTYRPPVRMAPRRNTQNMPVIVANPFRQLGGQPAKDGMRCSVLVRDPLAARLVLRLVLGVTAADHLLASRGVLCSHVSPHSCGFQKMNVQALFAIVVMASRSPLATSLGLGPMCL